MKQWSDAQASITTSLRERLPFMLKWVEKMVRRWAWERSLSVPLSVITSLPLSHVVKAYFYIQTITAKARNEAPLATSEAFLPPPLPCVCVHKHLHKEIGHNNKKQGKLRYHITSPNFEPFVMRNWQSVFANKDGSTCPCVVHFTMSLKGKETYTTFPS